MCIYIIVNRHYYFSLQSDLRACSLSVSGEGGVGDTCTRNCLNAWIMLIHMSSLVLFAFLCFQNKKMMATLHCKPLECMCPGCVLEFNLAMWNSFCDLSVTEDIGFHLLSPPPPFFTTLVFRHFSLLQGSPSNIPFYSCGLGILDGGVFWPNMMSLG